MHQNHNTIIITGKKFLHTHSFNLLLRLIVNPFFVCKLAALKINIIFKRRGEKHQHGQDEHGPDETQQSHERNDHLAYSPGLGRISAATRRRSNEAGRISVIGGNVEEAEWWRGLFESDRRGPEQTN